ncbi:carotenoid oxygenase [Mycolicibacterium fortuitum]|uniref:Dioxygenase n=1 Tax=Mycolicibacterium fortuitum TaxID=1766 RepID=A0A378UXC3_MYCFO|nr:carotenoid oxygenase [Mycolicibacterium fortuitum]
MIHGVRIENGAVKWYRNRWVRTDSFIEDFRLYNADGTRNLRSSVANTHVVNHAGKTLALVESSLPYQVTNDLETVGAYDFGGKLVDSMTAHPRSARRPASCTSSPTAASSSPTSPTTGPTPTAS